MRPLVAAVLLLNALLLNACAPDDDGSTLKSANVVPGDALPPMQRDIEQFQSGLPRRAPDLGPNAASSRDELIARFVRAVEDSNVVALRALRLDLAEFGDLYFPLSRFTRPPYELPPETLWLLIEQNGLKGESRLLQQYGGVALRVNGYRCEPEPKMEGSNRIWELCVLERRDQAGQPITERLFGSIMERDGRFKFVSIANRL